jgi:hypothetical protein
MLAWHGLEYRPLASLPSFLRVQVGGAMSAPVAQGGSEDLRSDLGNYIGTKTPVSLRKVAMAVDNGELDKLLWSHGLRTSLQILTRHMAMNFVSAEEWVPGWAQSGNLAVINQGAD